MADSRFEILSVLRSFDENGRAAPPIAQLAALARQRMSAVTATLDVLETSGDIKIAGQDSFEITARGRTSLARAELQIGYAALLRRTKQLRLGDAPLDWRDDGVGRGLAELQIEALA